MEFCRTYWVQMRFQLYVLNLSIVLINNHLVFKVNVNITEIRFLALTNSIIF